MSTARTSAMLGWSSVPISAIAIVVLVLGPTPVMAQASGTDPWSGIEEMVVVGTGSALITQTDSQSAIAFDEQILSDVGVQDIRDLSAYTPNLEIKTAFAAVNPTLFIRGVGLDDFNANSASAVSVYADGVYLHSPAGQLFGLFDTEGVDVLRGPQPTLTNASAGAILIRSKRPTQEHEFTLTTTLGLPNHGGILAGYNERTFEGALNIPIVPDVVAFRSAFKVRSRDGTTNNVCADRVKRAARLADPVAQFELLGTSCVTANGSERRGDVTGPSSLEERVNNVDNWAARAMVSATMPFVGRTEIDWLLTVNGGQNRSLATQYQHTGLSQSLPVDDDPDDDIPPRSGPQSRLSANGQLAGDQDGYTEQFTEGDAFAGEYDRVGREELDLLGASLQAEWEATDSIGVESLTAYVWHDRKTFANDDGGPRQWLDSDYVDESTQLSQELKADWDFGEDSWVRLGGTFLWERLRGNNVFRNRRFQFNTPQGRAFFAFDQDFSQRTIQWGVFAQTHLTFPEFDRLPRAVRFLENFDLDASIRVNGVRKQFRNSSVGLIGTVDFNVGGETERWTDLSGDVSLTYHVTDDINVYLKYSRGWKGGHFNLGTLTSDEPLAPVAPESLDSVELGLRSEWFDGRLRANLTAFWYDYIDLQVFQTTVDARGNILRRLINAESAAIQGIEFDFLIEPIDDLKIQLAGAFLDSEYEEFSTSFQRNRRVPGATPPVQTFQVDQDYSGNRLLASPEWSFTANVSYTIETSRFGRFRPWYIVAFRDTIFFGANEGRGAEGTLVEGLLEEPAYWIHSAGLTYTLPDGNIEVGFWIRNFLDKEYRIQSFDLGNPNQLILDVYGDPRTAGLTVTVRYGA